MEDIAFYIIVVGLPVLMTLAIIWAVVLGIMTASDDHRVGYHEKLALDRDEKEKAEQVKKAEDEKRAKAAQKRLAQLKKFDKALTFGTYELAEIVISVVDSNNYDKLKEVASVLSNQPYIDEVLTEASKKLSSGYEIAIKNIAGKRCTNINYSEKEVSSKLESLVDSCIAIGTGAIGKKIGHSAVSTGSSSSKGEIRKTKKWKN